MAARAGDARETGDADARSGRAEPRPTPPRDRKLRQAAFTYLHVGLLYEAAVYVLWRRGLMPEGRAAAVWPYLLAGAAIVGIVVWLLWFRRSIWAARVIWGLHALRLPALIEGAFFPEPGTQIPSAFFVVALGVVLVNLWMLARAGWDL